MKPQHRTPTKTHRSAEAYKHRALRRFMAGGKETRRHFIEQFRGSSLDDQRQIIKELMNSPGDSESSPSPGIDLKFSDDNNALSQNNNGWDWEDDHNYTDFLIQLDETIAAELLTYEETYFPDDDAIEDMGYYDGIGDNDGVSEHILCPVCGQSFLHLDEASNSLICVCRANISLNNTSAQEIRNSLSNVYDRHYQYCRSYCQSLGIDSREPGLKCEINNGGLLAFCSICGFRESVA